MSARTAASDAPRPGLSPSAYGQRLSTRRPSTPLRFLALAIALLLGPSAWAGDTPKRVLLLDSFGRNVAPISTLIAVFPDGAVLALAGTDRPA